MSRVARTPSRRGGIRPAAAAAEALEGRTMLSASLVQDINTDNAPSAVPRAAGLNGALYFVESPDTDHGAELWRSDGTPGGTGLLKDINPGRGDGQPLNFTPLDGSMYFAASDPTLGQELWKTDGTAAGTVPVVDLTPGPGGTNMDPPVVIGHTLYFAADNHAGAGKELWKSDGTAAGTVMVADLYAGASSSFPAGLTVAGGTLYFLATDATHGRELWKTDGTPDGTVLVKDFTAGLGSTNVTALVALGDRIVFAADDGTGAGPRLWITDGTGAGTVPLSGNLVPKAFSTSNPQVAANPMVASGANVYFAAAETGSSQTELWKTDGTPAGTGRVADLNPGASAGAGVSQLTDVGGTLYFSAYTPTTGREVWKTDGTEAGTVLVKDIVPGVNGSPNFDGPIDLTAVNGALYFSAADATYGNELWRSDGTSAGTFVLKDINSGAGDSRLREPSTNPLWAGGNRFFFLADDGVVGRELWVSDGTAPGTNLVADLNTGTNSTIIDSEVAVGGSVYFTATDSAHGTELWTAGVGRAGATLLADINPGPGNSSPDFVQPVGGTVYFGIPAGAATYTAGLWKTDGTPAGTTLVKAMSAYSGAAAAGGTLYFYGSSAASTTGLWKSDGTANGTTLVQAGSVNNVFGGAALAYFQLVNMTTGLAELWRTDGKPGGTYRTAGVTPVGPMAEVNGTLYFDSYDSAARMYWLWKTDGSPDGAVRLKSFTPIRTGFGGPAAFAAMGGRLFFAGYDTANGIELWTSDGTPGGTVLVKDLYPGAGPSTPDSLAAMNGTLYFEATEPGRYRELWKSDGTAAGTVPVREILTGGHGGNPGLLVAGGALYFEGDNEYGLELWRSDGTTAGTFQVADVAPAVNNGLARQLVYAGDSVYFLANDTVHGLELWRIGTADRPVTADVADVTPDPRADPVDAVTVTFDRPVGGFDLSDLSLTLDGGPNLLTAAQTLGSADGGATWKLGNLAAVTAAPGTYRLTLTAVDSGIATAAGDPLLVGAGDTWSVDPPGLAAAPGAAYTITGSGKPSDPRTLTVSAGTVTLGSDISATYPNLTLGVGAGAAVVLSATQHLAGLTVADGGTVTFARGADSGGRAVVVGSLAVAGAGKVDLTNNALIVRYAAGQGAVAVSAAWALVKAGWHGGDWAGSGVVSGDAAADAARGTALGVADNAVLHAATFAGESGLDGNQVLVRHTLYGDGNLDGTVNIADFAALQNHFNQPATAGWALGDFNYDGVTNIADFAAVQNNFNKSAPPPPASLAAVVATAAPAPANVAAPTGAAAPSGSPARTSPAAPRHSTPPPRRPVRPKRR